MFGLHDWARANEAWAARTQAHYGLAFTKGYRTVALGNPPSEPIRYVSHPVLPTLIDGLSMKFLGERWYKLPIWLAGLAGLCFFTALARKLLGDVRALLAAILICVFPLMTYFGDGNGLFFVSIWALWSYLHGVGVFPAPNQKACLVQLAAALFLMVQLSWVGVFFAAVIVGHYFIRLWRSHEKIRRPILAVILAAPALSVGSNFLVMLSGYDWNWTQIFSLFQWRFAQGERDAFAWGPWFRTFWDHAVANFTWPVLILGLCYCAWRVLVRIVRLGSSKPGDEMPAALAFAGWWYFLLPGLLFLGLFKGLLWEHQYWLRPLTAFVAMAAASALAGFYRSAAFLLGRRSSLFFSTLILALLLAFCFSGTKAYFAVRWQSLRTIELFDYLQRQIPPDKALLSFKDLRPMQHKNKPRFLRPEYAWHLDRDVAAASSLEAIQTAGDRYPIYFIPAADQPGVYGSTRVMLRQMANDELLQRYQNAKQKNDANWLVPLEWEIHQRHRIELIARLKILYRWEYFDNPDEPDQRGNTPCYLFYLTEPLPSPVTN